MKSEFVLQQLRLKVSEALHDQNLGIVLELCISSLLLIWMKYSVCFAFDILCDFKGNSNNGDCRSL